jgi:hypothetical protein
LSASGFPVQCVPIRTPSAMTQSPRDTFCRPSEKMGNFVYFAIPLLHMPPDVQQYCANQAL